MVSSADLSLHGVDGGRDQPGSYYQLALPAFHCTTLWAQPLTSEIFDSTVTAGAQNSTYLLSPCCSGNSIPLNFSTAFEFLHFKNKIKKKSKSKKANREAGSWQKQVVLMFYI